MTAKPGGAVMPGATSSKSALPGLNRRFFDRLAPDYRDVFIPRAGEDQLVATHMADPDWLATQITLRGRIWNIEDPRILATLWWYSASTVLVAPSLVSLIAVGTAFSPRLKNLVVHHMPSSRFRGSHSTAILGTDIDRLGAELGHSLTTVIENIAATAGVREPPLWAIATDAIANRLLWAGHATGKVTEATALATSIVSATDPRLPSPRYVDLTTDNLPRDDDYPSPDTHRFVRRASCCLLYRVPGEDMCSGCPGLDPHDRHSRLLRSIRKT